MTNLQRQEQERTNKAIRESISDIREAQACITELSYCHGISQSWKEEMVKKYNREIEDISNKLIKLYGTINNRDRDTS